MAYIFNNTTLKVYHMFQLLLCMLRTIKLYLSRIYLLYHDLGDNRILQLILAYYIFLVTIFKELYKIFKLLLYHSLVLCALVSTCLSGPFGTYLTILDLYYRGVSEGGCMGYPKKYGFVDLFKVNHPFGSI